MSFWENDRKINLKSEVKVVTGNRMIQSEIKEKKLIFFDEIFRWENNFMFLFYL